MPSLSKRLSDLHASPVRAMLETSQRAEVISFAGGLPAADSFPDFELPKDPTACLQYGPAEGERDLRALVAHRLEALGLRADADHVMILSGSQQGIDLAAKLVVDAGTPVAVEAPTYLAALQVFRFFGARFLEMEISGDGVIGDGQDRSSTDRPSMAYVNPTFQNPTGRCWSAAERKAFAQTCENENVILFEDDPYRDLVYDPCERRPVASWMHDGSWIYQGSFSKTLAPGLRLGFLAASPCLFPHLLLLKQAADLHTNRLSQRIVLDYLTAHDEASRNTRLVASYRRKRDAFASLLSEHLGEATWTTPPGGLFFWVTLPDDIDADVLLAAAMKKNVLFAPGRYFYADGVGGASAIRLNFSNASTEAAQKGVAVLRDLLGDPAVSRS